MPDSELVAMEAVVQALEGLEDEARTRVLRYAADRFAIGPVAERGSLPVVDEQATDDFTEVGDLMHAAHPTTGPERALVAGYWLQEVGGKSSGWAGAEVNDILKNMGHPLANVTTTMDSLKKRDPQLVMQTSKSGRSRQARKTYKLTTAGLGAVREMLRAGRSEAS